MSDIRSLVMMSLSGGIMIADDAMKAALEESCKERTQAGAKQAIAVLQSAQQSLQSSVQNLRDYRKAANVEREKIKKINRAAAYFGQSGNPIPLMDLCGGRHSIMNYCNSLGVSVPDADDPIRKVPDDFKYEEIAIPE